METLNTFAYARFLKGPLLSVYQKKHLFLLNISPSKILNMSKLYHSYLFRNTRVNAYPLHLKIDVTPVCQLSCSVCIHAKNFTPKQYFNNKMKMSLELFRKICDEVSGKTLVLSLYHMGESLLNKDIFEMINYASQKRLNTYITTNFSVNLSDTQITKLIKDGPSTIIIALDGFSQETYGKTRINGNVGLVKDNLIRLLDKQKKLNKKLPYIMIQSNLYDHNTHEKDEVERFCQKIGVDSIMLRIDLLW